MDERSEPSGGADAERVKIKSIFSGFIQEIRFMGMSGSWRAAYREKPALGKSSKFSPQSLEGLRIFPL